MQNLQSKLITEAKNSTKKTRSTIFKKNIFIFMIHVVVKRY